MSLQRNLIYATLDHQYQASITYQLARYAVGLEYKMLPPEVIHQVKRCLIDVLACAIGAYEAPGRPMCEAVVQELGGKEEATVFCSGLRTTALGATLVNSFMVRFLDFNDAGGGGHNSDSIPAIIAATEREKASGRDFVLATVISYELGARVDSAIRGAGNTHLGDIRGALSMPATIGRLMKLNEDQIANAIGTCAAGSLPLKILDAHREENCMRKNLRFGWVAHDAILSCLLAKKGFTGPIRIVEGEGGWRQSILKGDIDMWDLADFSGWRILGTRHKSLPANGTTIAGIQNTIAIVTENDLKPEDIARVRIKTCEREALHTTTFAKKYPRNAESADHSAPYANAIAIKERHYGADSMDPKKFTDPVVLDLIEKITVEADPAMGFHSYELITEITTKDGRKFQKHVMSPHGYGNDPLTDAELEEKFREMAAPYMGKPQIKQIYDAVWNIEKSKSLDHLMKLMVFKSR